MIFVDEEYPIDGDWLAITVSCSICVLVSVLFFLSIIVRIVIHFNEDEWPLYYHIYKFPINESIYFKKKLTFVYYFNNK